MAAATQPGFSQVLHSGPARFAKALTKSDTATFPETRGLYVGGEGTVTVKLSGDGGTCAFVCGSGTLLPICCTQLLSTGTDATSVVALW